MNIKQSITELITHIPVLQVSGAASVLVHGLAIDSRKVQPGFAYFAIKGTHVDGHQFIDAAIQAGAVAIFCQQLPASLNESVCYVLVEDTQAVVGIVAAKFYGNPSQSMKVVGVTGTNGKTTVTTLAYRLFCELGYKCGLISTVRNLIGTQELASTHTTPDPISVQELLYRMKESGCTHVFMEVSSHAVHQRRIGGIRFAGGVFTNITHDHLDYHHTFAEYIRVKKQYFDELPADAFALSNIDDKRGAVMLQNTKAKKLTYAIHQMADYKAQVLENHLHGLLLMIQGKEVHFRISGLFNAYNLLAVLGIAEQLGLSQEEALAVMSNLKGADGRFETYRSPKEGVIAIVDYAHTPDALLNVLATINQFDYEGKVITVVGCGGDRDKAKRPLMTTVACEHSDTVIITSDNPRSENPESILDDMQEGISAAYSRKILRITDRRQAIRTAVAMSQEGDIILVAGKGHEKYQEINGVKNHFDDVEEVLNNFKELDK